MSKWLLYNTYTSYYVQGANIFSKGASLLAVWFDIEFVYKSATFLASEPQHVI